LSVLYGCQSETGQIKSILLKHPKDALHNQEYVNANWKDLNYNGCPDYEKTIEEFDAFVELIAKEAADIYYLPEDVRTGLDYP
jgi:arginine deiminase